jgi:hypothetical protein
VGPGGVTGAAAQPLSLVSFGLPGPPSSPPAPRILDPVWQFECKSPLASGSGEGVAEAAVTQPTGIANEAAATTLTSIFFMSLPNSLASFATLRLPISWLEMPTRKRRTKCLNCPKRNVRTGDVADQDCSTARNPARRRGADLTINRSSRGHIPEATVHLVRGFLAETGW